MTTSIEYAQMASNAYAVKETKTKGVSFEYLFMRNSHAPSPTH